MAAQAYLTSEDSLSTSDSASRSSELPSSSEKDRRTRGCSMSCVILFLAAMPRTSSSLRLLSRRKAHSSAGRWPRGQAAGLVERDRLQACGTGSGPGGQVAGPGDIWRARGTCGRPQGTDNSSGGQATGPGDK